MILKERPKKVILSNSNADRLNKDKTVVSFYEVIAINATIKCSYRALPYHKRITLFYM